MGLNRAFESAILKLWGGFTSLAQPTVWRVREKEKEKKETESENDQDGRRRPSLRRADLCRAHCYSSSVSAKIAKNHPKNHALASAPMCTLMQQKLLGTGGNSWRSRDDDNLSDHLLGSVTSRMGPPDCPFVISGALPHNCTSVSNVCVWRTSVVHKYR